MNDCNPKGPYIKTIFFYEEKMLQRNSFPPSKQIFLGAEILKVATDLQIHVSLLKMSRNDISLVIYAVNYFQSRYYKHSLLQKGYCILHVTHSAVSGT